MNILVRTSPLEIISSREFQEAWTWLLDYISTNQVLIEEHGYFLDHKYWEYPDCLKCIDKCDNVEVFLARLYLVSQLSSVSDYLPSLKTNSFTFDLLYRSAQLDADVSRVINAQETTNHLNAFRNSLSESLAYWIILASIIKRAGYRDFSISKPNLQPEDKGPDGLACIVGNGFSIIKIISVKNSIISPIGLISSASFRNSTDPDLNEKKIFDEFYSFQNHNRGFERIDDKLNALLLGLRQDAETQIRWALLDNHSEFNATVVADDEHAAKYLFMGFNKIVNDPARCVGIYVGSENWKDLASCVQNKAQDILRNKGISF